jgi:hypothetical protein
MSVLIGSKDAESELNKREHDFLREVSYKQSKIKNATSRTWQFWVGATIILYFLVSISASSIFGEWDARTGRKSMIGGWRAETTYVYSKKDVPLALPIDKTKTTDDMNVYGPLMVLGKNEDTYYFTDWKYEFHNTEKPNVFVVKIYDAMPFGMQMLAPTSTPTRAQSPTSTHEITITP